jgi:hypothetical protein
MRTHNSRSNVKELYHYYNFKRTTGSEEDLYNTDNIVGECTYIRGNAQNLTGDVTWICGDVTGLSGDATGIAYYSPINYVYIGDITAMQPNTPIAELM